MYTLQSVFQITTFDTGLEHLAVESKHVTNVRIIVSIPSKKQDLLYSVGGVIMILFQNNKDDARTIKRDRHHEQEQD